MLTYLPLRGCNVSREQHMYLMSTMCDNAFESSTQFALSYSELNYEISSPEHMDGDLAPSLGCGGKQISRTKFSNDLF